MRIVALWIGKITYYILRVCNKRGATLPGLVVERISKSFLPKSLDKLPKGVVIITGTNGKTTTTKMLAQVLGANYRVLTNPTGSNFVRGIIACIIQHSRWSGRLPYDIGVFELDEAYAARFVTMYQPSGVVVLNIMRDQMDRFGEIDYTAQLLHKVVKNTTDFVVLNADDERVVAMAQSATAPVYYFGVAAQLRDIFRSDDELHDGGGLKPQTVVPSTLLQAFTRDNVATIKLGGQSMNLKLAAHGTYNAQNATAVCLVADLLQIDVAEITTRIAAVEPAFGRGERIAIGAKTLILQLVKNPGGFRHALMSGQRENQAVTVFAINDDYADGRDVSWLWDVTFAGLFDTDKPVSHVVLTAGARAADMALRLKYDDIIADSIVENLAGAIRQAIAACPKNQTIVVYATYTAMLDIRRVLAEITEVQKI